MRKKQEVTSRKKAFHYILNPALAFIFQQLRRLARETQSVSNHCHVSVTSSGDHCFTWSVTGYSET